MDNDVEKHIAICDAAFPRIGKALRLFWGHNEFPRYINELLADGQNIRAGFPKEITSALFSLQHIHAQQYPQFEDQNINPWG